MNLSEIFALRKDTAAFVRHVTDMFLRTDVTTGVVIPEDQQFAQNPLISPNTVKPFIEALDGLLSDIDLSKVETYAKPMLQVALMQAQQRMKAFQNVVSHEIEEGRGDTISPNFIENLVNPLFFGWFPGQEQRKPPAMVDGISIANAADVSLAEFSFTLEAVLTLIVANAKMVAGAASEVIEFQIEKASEIINTAAKNLPDIPSVASAGILVAAVAGIAAAIYFTRK